MNKMSNLVQGSTARIKITSTQTLKIYSANAEYFQRERQVYERLGKHPHVAELLDIQGQIIFLETGRCLRDILRKGNVTNEQRARWIIGLAAGLEYLHTKSILHADLNAANVIICKGGTEKDCAKWIDFGGSAIDNHEALASYDEYSYRLPEHPKPAISEETDMFAFGCTVFEIETGAPPYYHETRHMSSDDILSYVDQKYREGQYPSTEKLLFHSLITGCWQGRYESMRDLIRELKAISPHEPRLPCLRSKFAAALKHWELFRKRLISRAVAFGFW